MVMKVVCTHKNEDEAQNAAKALEKSGCETEVEGRDNGTWAVISDGRFVTRTVMEKF